VHDLKRTVAPFAVDLDATPLELEFSIAHSTPTYKHDAFSALAQDHDAPRRVDRPGIQSTLAAKLWMGNAAEARIAYRGSSTGICQRFAGCDSVPAKARSLKGVASPQPAIVACAVA